MRQKLLAALPILFFISCVQPKLTNWDRGRYYYYDENGVLYKKNMHAPAKPSTNSPLSANVLEGAVGVLPIISGSAAPKEPKKFFDLNDSVQKTLVKVFGEKSKNNQAIIDAIKQDYSIIAKEESKRKSDFTDVSLRLIFSNVKRYYNDNRLMHSNTRLAFLNTKLTIATPEAKFLSIDKIQNEFETIDMGKVERSSEADFTSKLTGSLSQKATSEDTGSRNRTSSDSGSTTDYNATDHPVATSSDSSGKTNSRTWKKTAEANKGVNGEVAYNVKNSISEAVAVNFNRIKTGFSLSDKSLTISQQGSLLRDINDVTLVTASFRLDKNLETIENITEVSSLFDENGNPNAASKLKAAQFDMKFYNCTNAKNISLSYEYDGIIRAPLNKKRGTNILEYDDKVAFYKLPTVTKAASILIDKNDYCKDVYQLQFRDAVNKYLVELSYNGDRYVPSFERKNAHQVKRWIQAALSSSKKKALLKAGNVTFFANDTALSRLNTAGLMLEVIKVP